MFLYPCDMILDVCVKHRFVATFEKSRKTNKKDKEEKRGKKNMLRNNETKIQTSGRVNGHLSDVQTEHKSSK